MSDLIDPTAATSPAIKRRVFVALSGSVAASASGFTPAPADEGLGAPHDPIVAEDDPSIVALPGVIEYPLGASSRKLRVYQATPKNASSTAPGVVVVQQVWGLDAQLRDVVRRFAKQGYCAIAPDLYSELGAPSGDGATGIAAFRPFAAKLDDDTVDRDLAICAERLRESRPAAKLGVTGFCMGGAIALRQTIDATSIFSAAAMWYGKVRYGTGGEAGPITPFALAYADDVGIPLAGSFGGRDTSILPDDVRALDRRLTALGKPHDLKLYDEAGHAFFDDTRATYVASAASDAWKRTLRWFEEYLRP